MADKSPVLVTTTPSFEGRRIVAYKGLVGGDAILGANAVVGVDLDYETIQIQDGGSMLMVSASGTAVVIE